MPFSKDLNQGEVPAKGISIGQIMIHFAEFVAGGLVSHMFIRDASIEVTTAVLVCLVVNYSWRKNPIHEALIKLFYSSAWNGGAKDGSHMLGILGEVKKYNEGMTHLSSIYNLNDDGQALKTAYKLLASCKEENGKINKAVAIAYEGIAFEYFKIRNFGKSHKYYHKSLEVRELIKGGKEGQSGYATACNSLGTVYYESGDYDRSLKYYCKAHEVIEKLYGEDHIYAAYTSDDIGSAYYRKGKYGKALKYCKKALPVYELVYGKEHKFTATAYGNLGATYNMKGDYFEALTYYYRALTAHIMANGKQHSDTAECFKNMATVYSKVQDHGKAIRYFKKALKIQKFVYGDNHLQTQNTSEDLERSQSQHSKTKGAKKKKSPLRRAKKSIPVPTEDLERSRSQHSKTKGTKKQKSPLRRAKKSIPVLITPPRRKVKERERIFSSVKS